LKTWNIKTPRLVYSGLGSVSKLKDIMEANSAKSAFVVLDRGLEGTCFETKLKLALEGYETTCWDGFSTNPSVIQCEDGVECFRRNKGDIVIAAGGGSAIDAAKYILMNSGFQTFVAIPTTCGTGAECSPFAIIKETEPLRKAAISHERFIPEYVILDPQSLVSLSREMIAATAMDTLAHGIEVHISKNADSLVRISTRGSLDTIFRHMERAVFDRDMESLEALQNVAFTARLLYPRTGLSIAHSLAHPLGAITDWHHGIIIALLLPQTLIFNKGYCQEFLGEINGILSLNDGRKTDIIEWIEDIAHRSEMFKHLNASGYPLEELAIDRIAKEAMKSSNIASNPREISSSEELKEVLVESLKKIKVR